MAVPCEDILGSVEDLIAGFEGFVSAERGFKDEIVLWTDLSVVTEV